MGSVTLLNEHGDWTITWAKENDERAAAMIKSLLNKGVQFWIVHPRGARSIATADNEETAMKRRHLAFDDTDIAAFLEFQGTTTTPASTAPVKPQRRPRGATNEEKAQDIAENESVGVRQRAGG